MHPQQQYRGNLPVYPTQIDSVPSIDFGNSKQDDPKWLQVLVTIVVTIGVVIGVALAGMYFGWWSDNNPDSNYPQLGKISGNCLEVHFIDVGHGDSIFVRMMDFEMIIDTGRGNIYDKEVLETFFDEQNVTDIDMLVLTHPDADHIGNTRLICERFQIEQVFHSGKHSTSEVYNDAMKAIGDETPNIVSGLDVVNSGTIYPVSKNPDFNIRFFNSNPDVSDPNDASIVTYLNYYKADFLLMGDATERVEQSMLSSHAEFNWKSTWVLKTGHHGSDTSTSDNLLDLVKPKHAVISCKLGDDCHPSDTVIERLGEHEVNTIHKTSDGTVSYYTDGRFYSYTEPLVKNIFVYIDFSNTERIYADNTTAYIIVEVLDDDQKPAINAQVNLSAEIFMVGSFYWNISTNQTNESGMSVLEWNVSEYNESDFSRVIYVDVYYFGQKRQFVDRYWVTKNE